MKPTGIDHKDAFVMQPPKGIPDCNPLVVVKGKVGSQDSFWSRWKPSWREWWGFLFGRPVWLGIVSDRHPLVMLWVRKVPWDGGVNGR